MRRFRQSIVRLCLAVAISCAAAPRAGADALDEFVEEFFGGYLWILFVGDDLASNDLAPASLPANGIAATYHMVNINKGLEPGEPTEGGLMDDTTWAKFKLPTNARVVIDTIGTGFDTVLAVYTGSQVNALTRITGNDDRSVSGIGYKHSLVAFNALANVQYSVQIGSKTGATGDIYAHIFAFQAGGLGVSLATVGGAPRPLGQYVCGYRALALYGCGNPRFVVYNATSSTVIVTPTHDLGAGIAAPAPFSLAPGAVTSTLFIVTPSFDTTTPRTTVGHFTFTARVNGNIVATQQHRALVVVKPSGLLANVLRYSVFPPVAAAAWHQRADFTVHITNTGAFDAVGCHVRAPAVVPSALLVKWKQVAPTVGAEDAPVTIPAGQTRTLTVSIASQQSRIASPDFVGSNNPIIDCANTQPAPVDLRNNFDLTARGLFDPAQVHATTVAPTTGVLNVPRPGYAVFKVRMVKTNAGTANFIALSKYVRPFDDWSDPNKQFVVRVCPANSSGVCTGALATSLTFSAAQYSQKYFNVHVWSPAVNPGYDPAQRRVMLQINQVSPVGSTHSVPVAAQSIALRRN